MLVSEITKIMKTKILSISAVALFLFFAAPSVFACSCSSLMTEESLKTQVDAARGGAKAVFTGVVISSVRDDGGRTVKFKLLKSWKGRLSKEVTLKTGAGGGDCGYPFAAGKTYLVYASLSRRYGSKQSLSTNICMRTKPIARAGAEIAVLNRRSR